jgi:hypothetical protein
MRQKEKSKEKASPFSLSSCIYFNVLREKRNIESVLVSTEKERERGKFFFGASLIFFLSLSIAFGR